MIEDVRQVAASPHSSQPFQNRMSFARPQAFGLRVVT